MTGPDRVVLGQVAGVYGVNGWIRVQSHTRPPEGIVGYRVWLIRDRAWSVAEGRKHGHTVVARLEGIDDRDTAAGLAGATIEVERSSLPQPAPGEVYWADLIGCEVVNQAGARLGRIERLFETGAQDVMVVEGERQRLIPFVSPIVTEVDVEARRVIVDWEPEY